MSIFFGASKKILDLTRRCPKCGKGQVVPSSRNKETIRCKACGAEMPPKEAGRP